MARKRITDLDAAISPSEDHELIAMKDGLTVKLTVAQVLALVIGAAGGTLDTLEELAAALGDDENFAATMATALSTLEDEDETFLKLDGSRFMTGDFSLGGNDLRDVGNLTGLCLPFAMNAPPAGWVKANGAALDRTTYARLFAAIGTTFGVGDGSTTFNIPDLRGEFVRGWDDGRGIDSGRTFGSLQTDAIRNILGSFRIRGFGAGYTTVVEDSGAFTAAAALSGSTTMATGPANTFQWVNFDASDSVPTAADNRPRNVSLLYCIKY